MIQTVYILTVSVCVYPSTKSSKLIWIPSLFPYHFMWVLARTDMWVCVRCACVREFHLDSYFHPHIFIVCVFQLLLVYTYTYIKKCGFDMHICHKSDNHIPTISWILYNYSTCVLQIHVFGIHFYLQQFLRFVFFSGMVCVLNTASCIFNRVATARKKNEHSKSMFDIYLNVHRLLK